MSDSKSKANGAKPPVFKFFVGSRSKVRTGCITCKIRRIKCDEEKPVCNRCTSTGRICDGYVSPPSRKRKEDSTVKPTAKSKTITTTTTNTNNTNNSTPSQVTNYTKPQVTTVLKIYPDCSPREAQCMDFFLDHSASLLTPWHGAPFWSKFVPQAGMSEPAIRHAMIAMAATHEQMVFARDAIPNDPRMEESLCRSRKNFALEQYTKSISQLGKLLANKVQGCEEIAMINCVLFVTIDCMWGNVANSMVHLHNGGEILNKWKEKRFKDEDAPKGSLEANLIAVFESMGHQACVLAKNETDDKGSPEIPLTAFDDLSSARSCIEQISKDGMQLIPREPYIGSSGEEFRLMKPKCEEERLQREKLDWWMWRFEGLVNHNPDNMLSEDGQEDMASLRLLYWASEIHLWSINPGNEQPLDAFNSFLTIAEELLGSYQRYEDGEQRIWRSLYDEKIWPSYSIVFSNCKDPNIKKRSLVLMNEAAPDPRGDPPRPLARGKSWTYEMDTGDKNWD